MRTLHLRPGRTEEARLLSDLALRSKGHRGDDQASLEADPGAEPLYLAMGARRCGSVRSGSIPGRLLPVLESAVAGVSGC